MHCDSSLQYCVKLFLLYSQCEVIAVSLDIKVEVFRWLDVF